jgi:hypothetical protein
MEQDTHYYTAPNLNRQLLLQQQYINHVNSTIPQFDAMPPVNVSEFSDYVQPVLPLSKPKRRQVKNACGTSIKPVYFRPCY